jgi:exopolysaccharide biosynthesis polyprenyl glycosylphosphotransferase
MYDSRPDTTGESIAMEAAATLPQAVIPETVEKQRLVVRSRHRDRDFALRRALLAADLLGLWLALVLAMVVTGARGNPLADSVWILATMPGWVLLFRAYGLYKRPIRRFEPTHLDDASPLFHALVIGALGTWLLYRYVPVQRLGFSELVLFGALALPLIAGLRAGLRVVNLRRHGPERVFVVAPIEDVRMLRRKLRNHPEYEMELVGAVTGEGASEELGLELSGRIDEIEALMASRQIDHLVVRLDAKYAPEDQVQELMHLCHREGVRFGCFPGVRSLLLPGVEVNHVEGVGILTSNPPILSPMSRAMKRGLDVAASATLLVALAPLMALAALLVRLDSRGPILYRQTRVGRQGRRFQLFKFRTMVPDAERLDDELMARSVDPDWLVMNEDPRVTRIGRFLRHSSIDELPQLWNVLRGEMSMVGPRPLSERDDRNVTGWKRHRLDLVPGLTGYWQVLGRNRMPFREMLEVDYAYIASWSMWHDIKLLARTIPVVLTRRGAN